MQENTNQPLSLVVDNGPVEQVQAEEVVQLDPRETFMIHTHSNIRFTAAARLSKDDNVRIQQCREHLYQFVKDNGDAARVALMLFGMEFDNTKPPFEPHFDQMLTVDWDTALKMWQEGFKNIDTTVL